MHVHALSSTLNGGSPVTARYEWDFGDSAGKYNKLVGWNAAQKAGHESADHAHTPAQAFPEKPALAFGFLSFFLSFVCHYSSPNGSLAASGETFNSFQVNG